MQPLRAHGRGGLLHLIHHRDREGLGGNTALLGFVSYKSRSAQPELARPLSWLNECRRVKNSSNSRSDASGIASASRCASAMPFHSAGVTVQTPTPETAKMPLRGHSITVLGTTPTRSATT